jgi:crotonobetainyl-CoA:carnitine CoA-transferase CaiB-like acyl-CoA transferase
VTADWAVDRDAYIEVPSGDATVTLHRSALRIGGTDCGPRSGVRHVGADNADVLGEILGIDRSEVDRLTGAGVLVCKPPPAPEPSAED